MANPFERRILYKEATLQIIAICTATLLIDWLVEAYIGHHVACLLSGFLLGMTVIGGGVFTIIHTLSHVGLECRSSILRSAAANHFAHHASPENPAHIRIAPKLWVATEEFHLFAALLAPLLAITGCPGAAAAVIGIVLGSYFWFVQEEHQHELAHMDFRSEKSAEEVLMPILGPTYHKGHHEPEDAERAERAPLALYAYQLWPEWVCGRKFYSALDACMVALERWGLLAA